jgi:HSP20 family protein
MKINSKLLLTAALGLALLAPSVASAETAKNICVVSTAASQASPQVVIYDPFLAMQQEMSRMNLEMNKIMQAAFRDGANAGANGEQLYSRISMETTPKEYRVTMVAPGLDEKDMKVEVGEGHTLTIRSEKNMVQKTSTGGSEHSFGTFTQMLTLPDDVDADHVHTSYKDNEYTVTLPRKGNGVQHSADKHETEL